MRPFTHATRIMLCAASLFLFSGIAAAGEKKLMHCFAFTPIETATDAQWQAFHHATDQIPKKISGVSHVWYGKLRAPMGEGGQGRKYGVCMEMKDADTLKAYASDPFHKEWMAVYEKVRVEGTTTFDILGQ
jgi:hypothetical protein